MNKCVQVKVADHGAWMCLVTYDTDFDTSRVFVDLEVAVEATMEVFVDKDEPAFPIQKSSLHQHHNVESDNESESVIDITEGEIKEVTCVARRAFPRSELSWTINNQTSSVVNISKQVNLISDLITPILHFPWLNRFS